MGWPKGIPFTPEMIAKRSATVIARGSKRKPFKLINGAKLWRCPTCRNWLEPGLFHHDKRTASGLKSQCKSCHQETAIRTRDRSKYLESKRRSESKRRARKTSSLATKYTKDDLILLTEILGERCLNCDADSKIQWDHVQPLSRGGIDHPLNFQPLCKKCNEIKQARDFDYRSEQQIKAVQELWVVEFEVIPRNINQVIKTQQSLDQVKNLELVP